MRRLQIRNHLLVLTEILTALVTANYNHSLVGGAAIPVDHVGLVTPRKFLVEEKEFLPTGENVDAKLETKSPLDDQIAGLIAGLIGDWDDIEPTSNFPEIELESSTKSQHEMQVSKLGEPKPDLNFHISMIDPDERISTATKQVASQAGIVTSRWIETIPLDQVNLTRSVRVVLETDGHTEDDIRWLGETSHTRRSAGDDLNKKDEPGRYYDESVDQVMQQVRQLSQNNSKQRDNSRWNQLRGMWGR